ncbi:MAG: hypothetical protein J5968_06975 [Oscillospiraceae bacterium]|nr:hypothetical protein [Oscillospiraceae bacterium]MBP1557755.1 hypothetical protein [Oscillospiraceae bacterium]
MLSSEQAQEMFLFFEKYVSVLYSIVQDEKEKLNSLTSNSLPRIEHAISVAQANAKQIENFEAKRVALQAALGCEGMTLSQIVEQLPESHAVSVPSLFRQLEKYVDEIRFINDKSMTVARDNMARLNPDAPILQPSENAAQGNNPYEAAMSHQNEPQSIFKTKI